MTKIEPQVALKMVANTLNCASLNRERVRMDRVDEATADILTRWKPRKLIVNDRDVILSGMEGILAVIRSWKAAEFNLIRTRGKRRTSNHKIVANTVRDEIKRQMQQMRV